MRQKLKVFFVSLILLIIVPGLATPKETKTKEVIVVQQKERFRKRVLFIYDCSGSMSRSDLNKAFVTFAMIAQQPIDSMEIAIIAFDDYLARWPGIPEPKAPKPIPKGWAGMPSLVAFQKAQKWLNSLDMGGGTDVLPALQLAFKEKRNEISIVIISDGGFTDIIPDGFKKDPKSKESNRVQYFRHFIKTLQKTRVKAKLDKIHINCYGIGKIPRTSNAHALMKAIAEEGRGSYVKMETVKKEKKKAK